jgi:Na+-translocating ferredoxin:NAD+ oxidoreductase RnfG subunit
MKKINEQPLLHFSLVLSAVAAFCGLAIGLTHQLTQPIIDERLAREQVEAYQTVIPEIQSYDTLEEDATFTVVLAKDSTEAVIGVIYIVTETNQYGDYKLALGVSTEGMILNAMFVDYQQTTTLKSITENNLALFIGLSLNDQPSSSDLSSGASVSYKSLLDSMSRAAEYQQTLDFVPQNPYETFVEDFASETLDTNFIPTQHVLSKTDILSTSNEVIASIYELQGEGIYQEGGDAASITLFVIIDMNQRVIGTIMEDALYFHSGGRFQSRIVEYLTSFEGLLIQDVVGAYPSDWTAGASSDNTRQLVDQLFDALKEVLS